MPPGSRRGRGRAEAERGSCAAPRNGRRAARGNRSVTLRRGERGGGALRPRAPAGAGRGGVRVRVVGGPRARPRRSDHRRARGGADGGGKVERDVAQPRALGWTMGKENEMSGSRLHELSALGQSVWIDSLSREWLQTGELARM